MDSINQLIKKLASLIIEKNKTLDNIKFLGIQPKGYFITKRLQKEIQTITQKNIKIGSLEPSLFKQKNQSESYITLEKTNIPFSIDEQHIIIIDAIINTGDTMKAALILLSDMGKPTKIEIATLMQTANKQFPISTTYCSKTTTIKKNTPMRINLLEINGEDKIESPQPISKD